MPARFCNGRVPERLQCPTDRCCSPADARQGGRKRTEEGRAGPQEMLAPHGGLRFVSPFSPDTSVQNMCLYPQKRQSAAWNWLGHSDGDAVYRTKSELATGVCPEEAGKGAGVQP